MITNVALDILAILISLVPIIYLMNSKWEQKKKNYYFFAVGSFNILMILGDLSDWLIRDTSTEPFRILLLLLSVEFYVSSAFVLCFFGRYMEAYLNLTGRVQQVFRGIILAMCAVQIFLAVISPFTGAFFYVEENGYQRGSLFWISQLVPLVCYLTFSALVILYRRKLNRREIIFFLLYIFIPVGGGVAQLFLRGIAVVNICVAMALLCIFVNIQFENELILQRQEKALAEQRIDIMLSQIQPHFLYNSLMAISYLCKREPERAQEAIQKFSLFLRENMESLKKRGPIPWDQELNHVKNYLYLEEYRFQERLQVDYDLPVGGFFIPPLTVQPLVENAVRHGLPHKEEGVIIHIRTRETDKDYLILVEDNGIGMEKSKELSMEDTRTHVGIENVRSRLSAMLGGSLEFESGDWGTTATIRIPKREEKG